MNPVKQALDEGYSENEVLNYMANAFPHLKKKINSALNTGYSAQQVINFVSGLFNTNKPYRPAPEGTSESAIHAMKKREDDLNQQQLIKTGLSLAGGAVAARGLQHAAPKISNLLSGRGVPKTPGRSAPALATQGMEAAAEAIPQTPTAQPGIVTQGKRAGDLIKEMGLEQRIKNLQSNNPPEVVAPAIKSMLTPGQKTWLKGQTDQPIEELVNEYLQEPAEEIQEKLVVTPDGQVGDLIEERQGIGSVKLPSGEIRRRKLSELDQEPPELAQQINEVISALPEEEKSRVLAFASYNPGESFSFEGKEMNIPFMGVQFHNGDFYMYPGVSKDQFDKVVTKATKAKTSGENEWGVWTQGDPSRGAGMHELKTELEKNFGKNFIKFKASEGYDFWKRFRKELKEYFLRRKGK